MVQGGDDRTDSQRRVSRRGQPALAGHRCGPARRVHRSPGAISIDLATGPESTEPSSRPEAQEGETTNKEGGNTRRSDSRKLTTCGALTRYRTSPLTRWPNRIPGD